MRRRKLRTDSDAGPLTNQSDEARERRGSVPAAADAAVRDGNGAPDLEKYLVHVAHLDMPLAQKIELLRAVQQIMQSFVDRAFGDDPVQLATGIGGNSGVNNASEVQRVVDSGQLPRKPNDLADTFRRRAGKRRRRKKLP